MVVIAGASYQPAYAPAYAERNGLKRLMRFRGGNRTLATIFALPSNPP